MTNEEAREILLKMAFAESTEFAEDRLFAFGYSDEHEALNIAIEALGKQTFKEPAKKRFNVGYRFIRMQEYYTCPECGALVEVDDNEGRKSEYYPACRCGQLIDWNGIIDICDMKWLDEYEEM